MGVSLTYETESAVSASARQEIIAAAKELVLSREWWCEPFIFFEHPNEPERLIGDSKLFIPAEEVSFEDDSFMAWRDAQFIIGKLAEWARGYSLAWRLSMEGHEMGGVTSEGPDQRVAEFFGVLALESGYDISDPSKVERIAAHLFQKHADRN
jgi:hypothetical protein